MKTHLFRRVMRTAQPSDDQRIIILIVMCVDRFNAADFACLLLYYRLTETRYCPGKKGVGDGTKNLIRIRPVACLSRVDLGSPEKRLFSLSRREFHDQPTTLDIAWGNCGSLRIGTDFLVAMGLKPPRKG